MQMFSEITLQDLEKKFANIQSQIQDIADNNNIPINTKQLITPFIQELQNLKEKIVLAIIGEKAADNLIDTKFTDFLPHSTVGIYQYVTAVGETLASINASEDVRNSLKGITSNIHGSADNISRYLMTVADTWPANLKKASTKDKLDLADRLGLFAEVFQQLSLEETAEILFNKNKTIYYKNKLEQVGKSDFSKIINRLVKDHLQSSKKVDAKYVALLLEDGGYGKLIDLTTKLELILALLPNESYLKNNEHFFKLLEECRNQFQEEQENPSNLVSIVNCYKAIILTFSDTLFKVDFEKSMTHYLHYLDIALQHSDNEATKNELIDAFNKTVLSQKTILSSFREGNKFFKRTSSNLPKHTIILLNIFNCDSFHKHIGDENLWNILSTLRFDKPEILKNLFYTFKGYPEESLAKFAVAIENATQLYFTYLFSSPDLNKATFLHQAKYIIQMLQSNHENISTIASTALAENCHTPKRFNPVAEILTYCTKNKVRLKENIEEKFVAVIQGRAEVPEKPKRQRSNSDPYEHPHGKDDFFASTRSRAYSSAVPPLSSFQRSLLKARLAVLELNAEPENITWSAVSKHYKQLILRFHSDKTDTQKAEWKENIERMQRQVEDPSLSEDQKKSMQGTIQEMQSWIDDSKFTKIKDAFDSLKKDYQQYFKPDEVKPSPSVDSNNNFAQ